MAINRLITTLLLAVTLAGCEDPRLTALRHENDQLKQSLEQNQNNFDYWHNQVAIAQACDAFIPICPESITEKGRSAQERGFSAGDSILFLVVLTLKLLILAAVTGCIIGFSLGAFHYIQRTKTRPAEIEIAQSHALLKEAEQAEKRTHTANANHHAIEKALKVAQQQLQAVHSELQTMNEQKEHTQHEIRSLNLAKEALRDF